MIVTLVLMFLHCIYRLPIEIRPFKNTTWDCMERFGAYHGCWSFASLAARSAAISQMAYGPCESDVSN